MRVGTDRYTGAMLTGWDHCVQCIAVVLTTEIGGRVMLREFGSPALQFQDANATPMTIMAIYVGVAAAIVEWEQGFRLRDIRLDRAGPDGQFVFILSGRFFPNGHLGDYSVFEDKSVMFSAANDNEFVLVREAA